MDNCCDELISINGDLITNTINATRNFISNWYSLLSQCVWFVLVVGTWKYKMWSKLEILECITLITNWISYIWVNCVNFNCGDWMKIHIPINECNVIAVMFLAMKFQVELLNLNWDISIWKIEPISIDSLLKRLPWNKLIILKG